MSIAQLKKERRKKKSLERKTSTIAFIYIKPHPSLSHFKFLKMDGVSKTPHRNPLNETDVPELFNTFQVFFLTSLVSTKTL